MLSIYLFICGAPPCHLTRPKVKKNAWYLLLSRKCAWKIFFGCPGGSSLLALGHGTHCEWAPGGTWQASTWLLDFALLACYCDTRWKEMHSKGHMAGCHLAFVCCQNQIVQNGEHCGWETRLQALQQGQLGSLWWLTIALFLLTRSCQLCVNRSDHQLSRDKKTIHATCFLFNLDVFEPNSCHDKGASAHSDHVALTNMQHVLLCSVARQQTESIVSNFSSPNWSRSSFHLLIFEKWSVMRMSHSKTQRFEGCSCAIWTKKIPQKPHHWTWHCFCPFFFLIDNNYRRPEHLATKMLKISNFLCFCIRTADQSGHFVWQRAIVQSTFVPHCQAGVSVTCSKTLISSWKWTILVWTHSFSAVKTFCASWQDRTPPKVEALNTQHKVEKSTMTRENRVCFFFFAERKQKVAAMFKDV